LHQRLPAKYSILLIKINEKVRGKIMNNYPKSKIENIVVQDFENEVLIYDLTINKAFCLNSTSAKVYQLCDGRNSIVDIAELLSRQLNEPITEDLIWLALDGLKKENLLEKSESFEINFNGLNRRQVIKKIGFASMIALPVIASVVAPSVAMAQSLGGVSALCTSPSDCVSPLVCNTINRGSLTGTNRCCVSGGTQSPGFRIACISASICNNSLARGCCSGMTTIGPPCFPGGDPECICI
jgi:Coenzyme PQQ synthesis protein D (PqqD)